MPFEQKQPSINPNRQERWDPSQRALVVETKEQLGAGLKEATIQLAQGAITVEGGDVQVAQITTRMVISASTEAEAKKFAQERQDDMRIQKSQGSVTCESNYQDGIAMGGGNIVIRGGECCYWR